MPTEKVLSVFRFGIRQKVILVLVTVLLTALTVNGWLVLREDRRDVLREFHRRGSDISRFVSKSLAFSVVGYDYHTIQLLLDDITLVKEVEYAIVKGENGHIMAQSGAPREGNLVLFKAPIVFDETVLGELMLGLNPDKTLAYLESRKADLIKRESLIIFMIAIGEFLALSFIIIRPVRVMTTTLKNSFDKDGHITRTIDISSHDEFGLLAAQFNQLAAQFNEASYYLKSKVDLADKKLRKTNSQLIQQSEELKCMNNQFRVLSVTDPLTGLYNRRHFEALMSTEVEMSIRHGTQNSLLLLDIDHFKHINDTHGHFAGDSVLKEIAKILNTRMRKTDILCRIGGEEFVIFCKRGSKEDAMRVAEELRKTFENHDIYIGESSLKITVSLGVTTISQGKHVITTENLFKQADNALYYSKENGRNRVTHYDDIVSDDSPPITFSL